MPEATLISTDATKAFKAIDSFEKKLAAKLGKRSGAIKLKKLRDAIEQSVSQTTRDVTIEVFSETPAWSYWMKAHWEIEQGPDPDRSTTPGPPRQVTGPGFEYFNQQNLDFARAEPGTVEDPLVGAFAAFANIDFIYAVDLDGTKPQHILNRAEYAEYVADGNFPSAAETERADWYISVGELHETGYYFKRNFEKAISKGITL